MEHEIKLVDESSNVNGLHKSSFDMSIDEELKKVNLKINIIDIII